MSETVGQQQKCRRHACKGLLFVLAREAGGTMTMAASAASASRHTYFYCHLTIISNHDSGIGVATKKEGQEPGGCVWPSPGPTRAQTLTRAHTQRARRTTRCRGRRRERRSSVGFGRGGPVPQGGFGHPLRSDSAPKAPPVCGTRSGNKPGNTSPIFTPQSPLADSRLFRFGGEYRLVDSFGEYQMNTK